jgi:hypothetical protein
MADLDAPLPEKVLSQTRPPVSMLRITESFDMSGVYPIRIY